jgi:ribonuclease T1
MLGKGWERWRMAGAAVLLVLSALGGSLGLYPSVAQARGPLYLVPLDTVAVAQLPPQGQHMLMLIYQGGPFRHEKDGVVFGNRERILPVKNRGYYREYTVRTPSERSRGARRIVCGGLKPAVPEACYYSDDHYASFRRIAQ